MKSCSEKEKKKIARKNKIEGQCEWHNATCNIF